MQVVGNGINFTTGNLLVGSTEEEVFGERILRSLRHNLERIRGVAAATGIAASFKGEVERRRTADLGDPREAGWTYLVNQKQPDIKDFIQALRPLAEYRGMPDPNSPLTFNGEAEDEWGDWLQENYSALDTGVVPHYVLIIGGPDHVPFHFQSLLDSAAAVGRVDFDSPEDLRRYADRIIKIEQAESPVVEPRSVFFAPDGGPSDPTYYSRRYMAEPLADHVRTNYGLDVVRIVGDEATKKALITTLKKARPALVYTASHGLAAPEENLAIQRNFNGAICCQLERSGGPLRERLFAAEDVPLDEPFLEGSVFFQFACFGYGTPAVSDFEHWLGSPRLNAKADFVAALPKRLLSHPNGPIAFVGHVDAAWMHGFIDDPSHPDILDRWHRRIEPFVGAVNALLAAQPVGLAMASMNKRYDVQNALLTNTYDRIAKGREEITPAINRQIANDFITRSDAQNYMVFGDPAARLRIPVRDD
jgi:hypothetical protein